VNAALDLDQLRTFMAIADSGSFTRAAEAVNRTQSAVSMQMRRLEERLGKPVFKRDGRVSRLTDDGERLLGYARRMIRLNDETLAAFDDHELSGAVRLGTPGDYAARFLPEVLARFARSNPLVEVSVECDSSTQLAKTIRAGNMDLAIVTLCGDTGPVEIIRREPLLWVGSNSHGSELQEVLPLAMDRAPCMWRAVALDALATMGRKYRILYTSGDTSAIAATVQSGLAVSVVAESALQPGMRVLSEAEGFPALPMCEIGLMRSWNTTASPIVDALAKHIVSALHNLTNYAQTA
jgi:DNA-binding transcriptional LysR family regulator